jgi:hypothetical protein
MPKLRVPAAEMQNREIIAKIRYGMEKQGVSHEELALAARMTKQTLYHRYKHPEQFRLCELRGISSKLHIPLLELLGIEKVAA